MFGLFSGFDGFAVFFVICAMVGGFFVLLRFVLQMTGGVTDFDTDLHPAGDLHHTDSDVGFKLLSLQGMAAFLLMFGLVGLALYQQSKAGMVFSMFGGIGAGLGAVWIVGKLFALAGRLQSSGNLAADAALGSEGTVYLAIPAGGSGRVTIVVQGRQRECDAVAADGGALPTGTPVRVVRIGAGIATVEKI